MKIRFAHAQQTDISQKNISIFDLVLGAVFRDIHPVKLFYEIAFPQDGFDHCKSTCRNNAFIGKLNGKLFIHDDRLLYHVFVAFIIAGMVQKTEHIS